MHEYCRQILEKMPKRHQEIIKKSFGIDGAKKSIEELCEEYNISRERIRQLESRFLSDLRAFRVPRQTT